MMRYLVREELFQLFMRARREKAPPLPPADEGPYKCFDEIETDEPPAPVSPDANR